MKSFTIMINTMNPIHYVPVCSKIIYYTAISACSAWGVT